MASTEEFTTAINQKSTSNAWKQVIDDVFDSRQIVRSDEIERLIQNLAAKIVNDGGQDPKRSSVNFRAKEMAWENLLTDSGLVSTLKEKDKIFLIDSLASSWESPTNVNVESKMVIHLYDREQRSGNWADVSMDQWPKYYELINRQHPYHEVIIQDINTNALFLQTSTHITSSEYHYEVEFNTLPIDKRELTKLGISNTNALIQSPPALRPISRFTGHSEVSYGETMIIKAGEFYFRKGVNTSYDHQQTEVEGRYNSVLTSTSSINFKQVSQERAFGLATDSETMPVILTRKNVYEFLQEHFNPELVNNFKKQEINKLLSDHYKVLNGGYEENGKIVFLYQEKDTKQLMEGHKNIATDQYTFIDGVSAKRADYILVNSKKITEAKESTLSLIERVIDSFGLKSRHALKKEKAEREDNKIKIGR